MKNTIRFFLVSALALTIFGSMHVANASTRTNYARFGTAYLQDKNGNALIPSGSEAAGGSKNAIDGDINTASVAGGSWDWTLHLDLGEIRFSISQVALTFKEASPQNTTIPEEYSVMVSSDGVNWTTVKEIKGNKTAIRRVHEFDPIDARFIRVRDLKAFVGISQMQIAEIEVYSTVNPNVLTAKMTTPVDNAQDVPVDSDIIVTCSEEVTPAFLNKVTLKEGDKEITIDKKLSDTKRIVTVAPTEPLKSGVHYTLVIRDFKEFNFTAGFENIAKGSKTKMYILGKNVIEGANPSSNAVDGKLDTIATPVNGEWIGTLELDFGSIKKGISRTNIFFSSVPPYYDISLSTDGVNWRVMKTVESREVQNQTINFSPTDARYMRIFPREMAFAVREVEVYCATDITPPTANLEAASNANAPIEVVFDEDMAQSTLNGNNITLKNNKGIVECNYVISQYGQKLQIVPNVGLDYDTDYTITFNSGVTDISGNALAKLGKSFKTELARKLEITTLSSTEYKTEKEKAIYPAFVDNMPYQSWTMQGSKEFYQLTAVGGKSPYKFSIKSGAIPQGLNLSDDGKISGTPTLEGNYEFILMVTDSQNNSIEKKLIMEANPYRGKWFTDAKFGVMTQWGSFNKPAIQSIEDIPKFEERVVNFNAEEWAQQIKDMGGEVFNFTVMAGNAIRHWPSKFPTLKEVKTTRNFVKELIDACHKRGIKFIAYIAPEHSWSPLLADREPGTMSLSNFTIAMLREILEMGGDGYWVDAGWVEGWTDWDKLAVMTRTVNPYAVMESNPGCSLYGYLPKYPNIDVQVFEGWHDISEEEKLHIGYHSDVQKKMAIDVCNLLTYDWAEIFDTSFDNVKSADMMINAIRKNWDNGATMTINFPVMTDGTFIHKNFTSTLKKIGDWVKANRDLAQAPQASLSDAVTYEGAQIITLSTVEPNAKIYYTTDNTKPTENSTLYKGPVVIDKSTRITAVTFAPNKSYSQPLKMAYIIKNPDNSSFYNFVGSANVIPKHFAKEVENAYVGMKITVKTNDLVIDSLGRYAAPGNSGVHKLKIVSSFDYSPIASCYVNMSKGTADSKGFVYGQIAPVTLKAGQTYIVISSEDEKDSYWAGDFEDVITNGASIGAPASTDATGTRFYTVAQGIKKGQLLSFKFSNGEGFIATDNIAIGANALLLSNTGVDAPVSGGINYASNAVDNNLKTVAVAGDYWNWTLQIDLGHVVSDIDRIKASFLKMEGLDGLYPTDYEIWTSTTGGRSDEGWIKRTAVSQYNPNLASWKAEHTYEPFTARYIRIRSLKPDGPGQKGLQMAVTELEVYQKEGAKSATTVYIEEPFADLVDVKWAQNSINNLYFKGYIKGTGNAMFSPNEYMTRGDFITLLERKFGTIDGFVIDNKKAFVTREDVAYYAYKFALNSYEKLTITNLDISFADEAEIATYAKDSVKMLAMCGIINGVGDNLFAPKEHCSRAMAAKIIDLLSEV